MDTRTDELVDHFVQDGGADRLRSKTGLPISTYFSGLKLRWILDNVPGAREKAEAGDALFGTIDSWVVWNLTGGTNGGIHITDVTNASRTQLMDLATLKWDEEILRLFNIPAACLPEIRSSSEVYGDISCRRLRASSSQVFWAISRQPFSVKPVLSRAKPRTPMALAASC